MTSFMQKVAYDPLKDFSPVMTFGGYTTYLVVPSDSPFKTYADLAKHIRSNPNQVVMGVTACNGCAACRKPGGESDQVGAGFDIPALDSTVEAREHLDGILGLVRNVSGNVRRDGLGKPDQE